MVVAQRLSDLLAAPKPLMGQPCNGCGFCCVMEPCRLATELIGATKGPCPALEYADQRTYCGLVKRPAFYMFGAYLPEHETADVSAQFSTMLGIGMGCDADDGID